MAGLKFIRKAGLALVFSGAILAPSCNLPNPKGFSGAAASGPVLVEQPRQNPMPGRRPKTLRARISKSRLASIMSQAAKGQPSSLAGHSSFYEILSTPQKDAFDIEQKLAANAADYEAASGNYFAYLRSLGKALGRQFGKDAPRKLEYALAVFMKKLVFMGKGEFAQVCFNDGYAHCSALSRMMSDFALVNGMGSAMKVILTPGHALVKIGDFAYATSLEDLKWPKEPVKYNQDAFIGLYGGRYRVELGPEDAVLFDTYEVASFKCGEKGDIAGELSYIGRMLSISPHCADAHRRKGKCLVGLGRQEEAKLSFSKALYCDPNDESSRKYLLELAPKQ